MSTGLSEKGASRSIVWLGVEMARMLEMLGTGLLLLCGVRRRLGWQRRKGWEVLRCHMDCMGSSGMHGKREVDITGLYRFGVLLILQEVGVGY